MLFEQGCDLRDQLRGKSTPGQGYGLKDLDLVLFTGLQRARHGHDTVSTGRIGDQKKHMRSSPDEGVRGYTT